MARAPRRPQKPPTADPHQSGSAPALISQPHGGALLSSGVSGHRGGPGRPSSVLREPLRGSFAQRVVVLEEIADDEEADPQDRIRAIDTMARYGLGTVRELSVDDVQDRLRETIAAIRRTLAPTQATDLLHQIREVWTK